ncbi:MAG: dNTP triphosphohydrolase [Acidobacteria bacterium]|nr:dNTP triphosphohydrolase [Acidobacteriota bacterium]
MKKDPLYYTKEILEQREEELLAPYAMKSARAKRRYPEEVEGRKFDYRTSFQHDRDRIIHSRAFRRLKHKTQVFVPYGGDHHRTRLTHTIEVSQIARTLARSLRLNEDLTEAIALAHDLGQPPFGKAGEIILSAVMGGKETLGVIYKESLKKAGGFKHNYQSLRVVDILERRYHHPGLNLTDAVREGILKHTPLESGIIYPDLYEGGLNLGMPSFFEAQAVAIADEVAQKIHDLEDGMRAGIVELARVEELAISREVIGRVKGAYRNTPSRFLRENVLIRGMIHLLVTDIICASGKRIDEWCEREGVRTSEDFYQKREKVKEETVEFSPRVKKLFGELSSFVSREIINSLTVSRADYRAKNVIASLFATYYKNPLLLEDYVLLRMKEEGGVIFIRDLPRDKLTREIKKYQRDVRFIRLLADHIAGMSDEYALKEYERLTTSASGRNLF